MLSARIQSPVRAGGQGLYGLPEAHRFGPRQRPLGQVGQRQSQEDRQAQYQQVGNEDQQANGEDHLELLADQR